MQETVWLGNLPVATLRGSNVYRIHTDHLGTPRTITDIAGNLRWRWEGDPFGNTAPNENPAGLGAFTYNGRFPGQVFDAETGLHQNGFRDYAPGLGRYAESDPIGIRGGVSFYGYVGQSPLRYRDLLGLDRWPAEGGVAIVYTNMKEGWTTFYDSWTQESFTAPTDNSVARSSLPGANGPYSSLVTYCERGHPWPSWRSVRNCEDAHRRPKGAVGSRWRYWTTRPICSTSGMGANNRMHSWSE